MQLHASRLLLGLAALAAVAACSPDNSIPSVTAPDAALSSASATGTAMRLLHAKVCPSAAPGEARCHSLLRVDESGSPLASSGPTGYAPADLLSAYSLAATGGAGQTIAIVDAYDD